MSIESKPNSLPYNLNWRRPIKRTLFCLRKYKKDRLKQIRRSKLVKQKKAFAKFRVMRLIY
jgi:hypothetical protein